MGQEGAGGEGSRGQLDPQAGLGDYKITRRDGFWTVQTQMSPQLCVLGSVAFLLRSAHRTG